MPDNTAPQKHNLNKLRDQLQQAVDANATLSQSLKDKCAEVEELQRKLKEGETERVALNRELKEFRALPIDQKERDTIKVLREQLEILTGTRSARASTVDGLSMQLDQTENELKETKELLATTQYDLAHEKTRVVNLVKANESQAATIDTLKGNLHEWQSKYAGKSKMLDNAHETLSHKQMQLAAKVELIERLCSMETEDVILTVIRGGVCKVMKTIVDEHSASHSLDANGDLHVSGKLEIIEDEDESKE